jgi:acetolactate synthase-1/2/3 large subunit
LGVLTRAATEALTAPTGPVSVEVPIDLQREKIARPAMLDHFVLPVPAGRTPSDIEMNELAARVAAAKRPMLWIGSGARAAGAEIHKLLDMGFTVVNSINGKGTVAEDHPMSLGGMHGNGMPGVQEFYATCDLLLAVGTRLRARETGDLTVKLPSNIVHIDCDPLANGRTYPDTFFVCGDAKLTLRALLPRIDGKMALDPSYQAEFADLKRKVIADYLGTLGAYGDFSRQLREVLPNDAIWVRDVTQSNSTWGDRVFPVYSPHQSVFPVGAGIGQGLSLGIGAAAAADGHKTVVMTGDGGFFLNVGELWTAVQEKLDMVVMVMNDRGYGVIKRIQDATQHGRRFFADLQGPDIGKLAALAEVPYFKCDRADTFGATVAEALAIKGLTMVEVDMNAVGEFPPYYPFNQRLG